MQPYVAIVGAVNLDICGRPYQKLILRDSNPGAVRYTPGGVGRNIAHDLCLLGERVLFVTVFGGDPYGESLRRSCEALGMDLSQAETIPDMNTSTYVYITDEHGEMQLALSDTDISACITPAFLAPRLETLNRAAVVVLDGNLSEETLVWLSEQVTAPIFVDPVSVTKAERIRPILPKIHTFKPNLTEGQHLTGRIAPEDVLDALLAAGVKRVFLSIGADGILAGAGEERLSQPCYPTRMVNTTGGGDAVMAALIWAYLHGKTLGETVSAALRAGKCAVEYDGTNNPALCSELLESV